MDTTEHTPSPTTAAPASQPGALAHFVSTCTCGLEMRNTVRSNVDQDVREHLAWANPAPRKVRKTTQRCESGWTGDRCTKRLFHTGPHSNER